MLLTHTSWAGPCLTVWFGHLSFSNFQFKLTYVLYAFFASYLVVLASSSQVSSTNFFDYLITIFNFFICLWFMSFSNNIFSFIFFLELLSAAITLLLVSSSFSSFHFYNSLTFSKHSYFGISTPTAFLQTLMLFFWITLVSSLALFVFLLAFYLKFLSFDLGLINVVFSFLVAVASLKSTLAMAFSWLLFLVCISIKCGLVPFYLWKPSFFKGMTLLSLFFYLYVYYFTVFLLFTYIVCLHLHELFVFYLYLVLFLIVVSTLGLASLLFESYYVKAFLALSSILNSTLVLYAFCGLQTFDSLFFI